jgi:hypothetical protein
MGWRIDLLRVGFGEAGAGIISANLSSNNKSTVIDPLLPGIRVYAIFGFCDIHHFEDGKKIFSFSIWSHHLLTFPDISELGIEQ